MMVKSQSVRCGADAVGAGAAAGRNIVGHRRGSGSISVEWCLAGGRAFAIEARADRAANIRTNAAAFGVAHHLTVVEGSLRRHLRNCRSACRLRRWWQRQSLFDTLWAMIPAGTRLVANA